MITTTPGMSLSPDPTSTALSSPSTLTELWSDLTNPSTYHRLCTPTFPFTNKKANCDPPFYALDDELPLVLAIPSGLQHALAMLAGLITPPIILASSLSLPADMSAYMISASLIGCGELYFVKVATSFATFVCEWIGTMNGLPEGAEFCCYREFLLSLDS